MDVTVNGEPRQLPEGITVDELIETLDCGRKGTAIAVNEEVVPRSTWTVAALRPGDRVEVLTAKQGG